MNSKKGKVGGPGILITAAFIGPGTVTVCSLAGVGYGVEILWAVLLSIIMTILFQEMASRIGIITQFDLASLIRRELKNPVLRLAVLAVVICAIIIGNGAYEAGNIAGGALGLDTFITNSFPTIRVTPIIIGGIAFLLLWFGSYKILERAMVGLVGLMSLSFIITALLTAPNILDILSGLFIPTLPEGSLMLVLGVIGTTMVPYNLFLHAALSKARWNSPSDLNAARKNTIASIFIGGLVSLAIVISASSLQGLTITNAVDLGNGLQPIYGKFSKYLISSGLFAAGITSAITAPLAASYVAAGCFGIEADLTSWKFKITWMIILFLGVLFASLGFKPIDVIRFAQVANGLMLPIIGIVIVWLASQKHLLGEKTNKKWLTLIAYCFIILITILGFKTIWQVL